MNTNIDTSGYEPVIGGVPRMAIRPPIELQPAKSPFFISPLPTTAVVNPDSIKNFNTPGIPQYRITPPIPLTAASGGTNATATVSTAPILLQPTPAPTIAQALTTIPTGFTFSFNQVRLPLSSTLAISSYKIYRGSANNSASASVIQAIPHHPAGLGVPVVIQDNQVNGVVAFYWVSAVSTSGQESALTSAQSSGVTSNAGFNANSQIAGSAHMNALNASFTPDSTFTLQNDGVSPNVVTASQAMQFGFGNVVYNSGSVSPTGFQTSYIFADDPQFQGGAVIYQFSQHATAQTAADGRLNFGALTTVTGTFTTGGGSSGGSAGLSGGRGFALASS